MYVSCAAQPAQVNSATWRTVLASSAATACWSTFMWVQHSRRTSMLYSSTVGCVFEKAWQCFCRGCQGGQRNGCLFVLARAGTIIVMLCTVERAGWEAFGGLHVVGLGWWGGLQECATFATLTLQVWFSPLAHESRWLVLESTGWFVSCRAKQSKRCHLAWSSLALVSAEVLTLLMSGHSRV